MNNKFIITSLAAIALGATGFFMTQSMDNSSLTPTQLSNIEALADPEGWGEVDYANACNLGGDGCALKGGYWFPTYKPEY